MVRFLATNLNIHVPQIAFRCISVNILKQYIEIRNKTVTKPHSYALDFSYTNTLLRINGIQIEYEIVYSVTYYSYDTLN